MGSGQFEFPKLARSGWSAVRRILAITDLIMVLFDKPIEPLQPALAHNLGGNAVLSENFWISYFWLVRLAVRHAPVRPLSRVEMCSTGDAFLRDPSRTFPSNHLANNTNGPKD
jgi:hypothetical protein